MATTTKKRSETAVKSTRQRKLTRKQKKVVGKKEVNNFSPIPNVFRITATSYKLFAGHRRIFTGLLIVYILVYGIFAAGFSGISSAIGNLHTSLDGQSRFQAGLHSFGLLLAGGGTGSSTSAIVQTLLIILQSLAIIYVLRNTFADKTIKLKQAYYQSTSQLVPFLLILVVILLQLIPFSLGLTVLTVLLSSSVINGSLVVVLVFLILGGLFIWSMYMISSSIFALYIVTLPGMTPRRALKSGRDIVRFRRFKLMRRVLFLPLLIGLLIAIVVIPVAILSTTASAIVFYVLASASLFFIHSYLYSLYRSLIA